MKKVRKDLSNLNLTTTPSPIRAGRNPAYYPILVLPVDGCQIDEANHNQILDRYPGAYLKEVRDRHRVLDDVYDVWESGWGKPTRYRHHPEYGWLEEINQVWTVSSDYPTALASGMITDFEDQGVVNLTTAMRFGIQVVSLLLGNDNPAVRNEILDMLAKIMLRTDKADFAQRIEIDGDGEEIKLSL